MKKTDIPALLYKLAMPAVLVVLGSVLLLVPDLASVLVSKILGWGLLAVGVGFAAAALIHRGGDLGKILGALACIAAGSYLSAHPLWLARWVGRLLGLLLLVRGGREWFLSSTTGGRALSLASAALGLVLLVLPMTAARWVFSLCGVLMILLGICLGILRLREGPFLPGGDDPNIIDAL